MDRGESWRRDYKDQYGTEYGGGGADNNRNPTYPRRRRRNSSEGGEEFHDTNNNRDIQLPPIHNVGNANTAETGQVGLPHNRGAETPSMSCMDHIEDHPFVILGCVLFLFLVAIVGSILGFAMYHNISALPEPMMGFDVYRYGNKIDLDRVYTAGRYKTGIDHKFEVYPTLFQSLTIDMPIFGRESSTLQLKGTMYWRLRPERLSALRTAHGKWPSIHRFIVDTFKTKLRNTAPNISSTDWIEHYDTVTRIFAQPVLDTAEEIGVDMETDGFVPTVVELPDKVQGKYLSAALQTQQAHATEAEAMVTSVTTETQKQVAEIDRKILAVRKNAEAQAFLVKRAAEADSERIVEEEKAQGMRTLMDAVGLDPNTASVEDLQRFHRYMMMLRSETGALKNTKMIIGDVKSLIVGNNNNPSVAVPTH